MASSIAERVLEPATEQPRRDGMSSHILPTSSAMVGVCLTIIAILKLLNVPRPLLGIIDSLVAVNSLCFLISSILSYLSLRAQNALHRFQLERYADIIFLLGLTVMVGLAFVLAYEAGVSDAVA